MKKLFALLALLASPCFAQHYVGDYAPGSTVCRFFSTYQPSTGAAFALASGAVDVYQEGSDTQDTDDSGATLTASVDSVAGMNRICIDTSTDGTFYAAGRMISVVLTAGTVDSISVAGTPILSFSLNKEAALKPTTAGRALDVSVGGEAGIDWANVGSPTTTLNLSGTTVGTAAAVTTVNGLAANVITATAIDTGAVDADAIAPDAIGSSELAATAASEIADQTWEEAIGDHSATVGSTAEALAAAGGGGATDQELGIVRQGTAQSATGTTIVLDSGAAFADDVPIGMTVLACGSTQGYCQSRAITDYVSSTDTATVETWTVTPSGTITFYVFGTAPGSASGSGATAQEVWEYATRTLTSLGTGSGLTAIPWNAAWDAEVQSEAADALDADNGANFTSIPWNVAWDAEVQSEAADAINADTGDSFTAIPWNANWDAEVQSEATDAFNAYDPPTGSEMDAGFAWVLTNQQIIIGTCDSGSTTTCVDDALTQADASQLEDRLICYDDSWCALITTFTPGTDTATTTKVAPSTRASRAYTIFPATVE